MYTFAQIGAGLAIVLLAVTSALAQNLVTNPDFDDGTDDWLTSAQVEWSPSFGYEKGSMHLTSEASASMATQCIAGGSGYTYVAAAQVYAHCAGARLYVFWAATEDCSDTGAFADYAFAVSSAADRWEQLTVTAPSPHEAHFIELMLYNGGGCADGIYFDDVTLQYDDVFTNGFDPRTID